MVKPHSQTDFGVEIGTALEPVAVFYTKLSPDGLKQPTLWGQQGTGGVEGGGQGEEVGGVGMWRGGEVGGAGDGEMGGVGEWRDGWGREVVRWVGQGSCEVGGAREW